MKKEPKTNFAKFLNKIYNCKKISLKDEITTVSFLQGFFDAAGSIAHADYELAKSVFNGNKPLSDTVRGDYPKKPNTQNVVNYVKDLIEPSLLDVLFEEFEIEPDEKRDFDLFARAIVNQFENFMKYGDVTSTTVKSYYEYLLDQQLPKADNPNENALYSAKECLYSALDSFSKINPQKVLYECKGSIENALQSIYNSFKAFEKRSNHLGMITYKSLRDKIITRDTRITNYLKMVSEPGSLPLSLVRGVDIIVYNPYTFDDWHSWTDFAPDDDQYGVESLKQALEGNPIRKIEEIEMFFTENMIFHLEDDRTNLIPDIYYLFNVAIKFWNGMEKELISSERIKELDKRIRDKFVMCQNLSISFTFDGTYYVKEQRVEYAINIEQLYFDTDGRATTTGQEIADLSKLKFIQGDDFVDKFKSYFYYSIWIYKEQNADMMNECVLINKDKCRYYIFAPTCKARTYRKIREIANVAFEEKADSFLWVGVTMVNWTNDGDHEKELELLKKTSAEREALGEECVTMYGFHDKKLYIANVSKKDIMANNVKKLTIEVVDCLKDAVRYVHFLVPIMMAIVTKADK